MAVEVMADGWACSDCIMLIANGDGSGIEDPESHERNMGAVAARIPANWHLVCGGEHSDECTPADRDAGCDCETQPFSWQACDTCGSNLGGARHAVTWLADVQPEREAV